MYPYYDANPNTGDRLNVTIAKPVVACNAVHFAPELPSRVTLPVVSMSDLPKNKKFGPTLPVLSGNVATERVVV